MKIDRTRFLLLTAAIGAAAACTIKPSDDPGTNDGGTTADSGTQADAAGKVDGSTSDAAASDAASDATQADATTTTDAGTDARTDTGTTGDSSTGDSSTTTDSGSDTGANACSNDVNDLVDGGGAFTCPSGETSVGCLFPFDCTDLIATHLRARPAYQLSTCLAAANGNACTTGSVPENLRCMREVINDACPDSTVAAYCNGLRVSACGTDAGTALADCEDYAALLTTVGRNDYESCIQENGCLPEDVQNCIVIQTQPPL